MANLGNMAQKKESTYAYTLVNHQICKVLKTKVEILEPKSHKVIYANAEGVWDTGATSSVIDRKLAEKLGLKEVNYGTSYTANGIIDTKVYYLSFCLPDGGIVPDLLVSDGNLPYDLLIGMDVITKGDFHISNDGNTIFTFRMPSSDVKDYKLEEQRELACATDTTKR